MENRLAPYPDHIPFHAGVQAIVEEDSPFLREKRSEFLLNAVLNFPRTMPKKEFFEDLAALVPDAEAACEICAGAFAAEGRDAHGRLPRQTCIDLGDEDDVDEEQWTPQRMENMRCAGPFDNRSDIADGLKTVWERYRGLDSLRCALMDAVRQNLESIRAGQEGRDAVRERFEGLRRMAGLTRVEFDLLVYVFLHREGHCDWSRFVDGDEAARNVQQTMVYCKVAAACLGTRNEWVRRALAPDGPLVRYGWVDPRHCELGCGVSLYLGGLTDTPAENFFYHPLDARPLPWEYFDEKTRELGACAEALVRARRGRGGVNLLLHGAPGTGKTSFAQAFARRLGMKAYGISFGASSGRSGESAGDEVSQASFRFGALDVADRNCRPGRDLIVVDEADTLLARAGTNRLNDALDGSRCVRLWITNLAPSDLPDSNLRRFDLALPFEPLGPRQRAMIWRNSLARNRIGDLLGEDAVEVFSRVRCAGETGVEMEALAAASTAALTIYDMCKAVQRDMEIDQVFVLEKDGGASGRFLRDGI